MFSAKSFGCGRLSEAYATYGYGLDGELATIADANGNLTTSLYDGFDGLSQIQYPVTDPG